MTDWKGRQGLIGHHLHTADQIRELADPDPIDLGTQAIRLLGPFHVTADTPGISTDGAILVAIEPGQLVLDARAVIFPTFTGLDPALTIGVAPTADPTDWLPVTVVAANFNSGPGVHPRPTANPLTTGPAWIFSEAGGYLIAFLENAADGEADIYALIAEPS